MHGDTKRIFALIFFGVGAILFALGVVNWGGAFVSAGLFVEAL